MPKREVPWKGRDSGAFGSAWIWAGADDAVDDGAAEKEQEGAVAFGTGIHPEMGHRGDDSLHKAKLRVGGCAGIELSEPSEHDAAGMRCRLFRSGDVGYSLEAQGNGGLCIESGETGLWHTRVSLLLHCRWSDKHLYALSRANHQTTATGYNARYAVLFQCMKILGELLPVTTGVPPEIRPRRM